MCFLITNPKPALPGQPLGEPMKMDFRMETFAQLDMLSLEFWDLQREM
jgi:hypothetical protein